MELNKTESNQVFFRDESIFNLGSDDNCVLVSRPRGEHLNLAFSLQRHTTPTACVGMRYHCLRYTVTPILIYDTMAAQWHVHDILQPHVLPLMAGVPGAIFHQDISRPYTARMSQYCLHHIITLPWPVLSSDLSPIEDT
ncbi:transposable element Tcb2 transposase [Trichonephila clavipes]|nr:transposable element Tcb2 transposase [Trichonephila clavipes]